MTLSGNVMEEVQAWRVFGVCEIEEDCVLYTMLGNALQYLAGCATGRVNE